MLTGFSFSAVISDVLYYIIKSIIFFEEFSLDFTLLNWHISHLAVRKKNNTVSSSTESDVLGNSSNIYMVFYSNV